MTIEEKFAVICKSMIASEKRANVETEVNKALEGAVGCDFNLDAFKNALKKEYNSADVLVAAKDLSNEEKEAVFYLCLDIILADGKITDSEVFVFHNLGNILGFSSSYVTMLLLGEVKENPALTIDHLD
ncbi:MAG: hypothetical protein MJZ33_05900 [Paludibacteraceae bacterium]|nr:hypothetical protein [Paludibacteraceae bacterium]